MSGSPSRIQPLKLAVEGYRLALRGFDDILRLSWFAVLALALLARLLASGAAPEGGGAATVAAGGIAGLALLAGCAVLVHAMVAVAWHRMLLLGERWEGGRIYLRLGRRELLYGAAAVLFAVFFFMGATVVPVALVAPIASSPLPALATLAGLAAALVVIARSVLVLPAVALDRGLDLAASWRATRGQSLRATATLVLAGLPLVATELALMALFSKLQERDFGTAGLFVDLLAGFVGMIVVIVMVCGLAATVSLLYARLVGPQSVPRS